VISVISHLTPPATPSRIHDDDDDLFSINQPKVSHIILVARREEQPV
jgi:hypothetical protein